MTKYVRIKKNSNLLKNPEWLLYRHNKKYGLPDRIKVLEEYKSGNYRLDLILDNGVYPKGYVIDKRDCEIVQSEFQEELDRIFDD